MNQQYRFESYEEKDFDSFLEMSRKLWRDIEKDDFIKLLENAIISDKFYILLAKNHEGSNIGFAIFSLRTDYVEGAMKSPTGYLEGIFVEKKFRNLGLAKTMVKIGENWCKERGCTQIGSDTWLDDQDSRDFHKRIGFWEEEEIVHFLKDLK